MKIKDYDSVEKAVRDRLTPDAYSYDGQLEKLKSEIDKLQDVVSTLVECLYGEMYCRSKVDQLTNILGYGYEVEE